MTNDEIDKLEAGRELDALVAEKVMGLEISQTSRGTDNPTIRVITDGVPHYRTMRCYSTNISAAWEVVEKLQQQFHLRLNSPFDFGDPYFAGFTPLGVTGFNGRPDFEASAPTAPLAICRTALKAKLVDNQTLTK